MKTDIITIGNEILIGQIVDTNSAWLANELTKIGTEIRQIISISDEEQEIISCIKNSKKHADLIILTGGLGPTNDDITKKTLAKYFNSKLVSNKEVLSDVTNFIEKRNLILNKQNIKQAEVPENCKVIRNSHGTAAGMWFEMEKTILISLPGVPHELFEMVQKSVIPLIKKHFTFSNIIHKTIQTYGVSEAMLASKIANWENDLPTKMKLAYLPAPERLRLRLSYIADDNQIGIQLINNQIKKLKDIIGKYIFGEDDQFLHEVIGDKLRELGKKVTTAESCTGGNIARLIVSVPNSSDYFDGGLVAYSNKVKNQILGVKQETLDNYGAVSKQTVEEMALGALKLFQTDYAIAVSGIAGPGGATKGKPVGTTWIAVADNKKVLAIKYVFGDNREINIRFATNTALNLLRRFI